MRIVVCKPTYGGEDRDHGRCKRALEQTGVHIIELEDCPYIDMARAALVEMADKHVPDWDVMVWIDHDIIFRADDVLALANRCHESDYDILGVLYSMRRPKFTTIGRPADHVKEATFYMPGLIDGMFTGMGFTAVKRRVFEKLKETLPFVECPTVGRKVYPYFSYLIRDGSYLGEDISFCWRATDAGFKVGIDCEPRILHRGRYDYALEDTGLCVPDLPFINLHFDRHPVQIGVSDITNQEPKLIGAAAE